MEFRLSPRVREALKPLTRNRLASRPISLALLVKATRSVEPNIPLSDEELANLLAQELIHHGCAIDFDIREGFRHDLTDLDRPEQSAG
ncbi:MAG TPA: hypothetical protein VFQ34_04760 [Nitrospiraceae bacterium]|nr:hypothetical protein [Nitrospiraceae bacterium]